MLKSKYNSEVRVADTTFTLSEPGQLWGGSGEENKYPELDPEAHLWNFTVLLLNQVHTVKIIGEINWNN